MGSLKSEEELEQIEEEASKEAILYVNGSRKVLPDGLAHATLLEYLRGTRSLRRGILRVRSGVCCGAAIMLSAEGEGVPV